MISSSSSSLLLFYASMFFIVSLTSSGTPYSYSNISDQVPKFNYSEPQKWGSIDIRYARCSRGKQQSPIDINTHSQYSHSRVVVNKTMQPLTRDYHVYNASLSSNGIQVQLLFNGRGHLIINEHTYNLTQMHWHTPSEHRFNAIQYAAELHQVHTAPDGSRAVVAILYKYGKPDPLLTMLKPQLDELAKEPCEGHETQVVIPKFASSFVRKRPRRYYRYPGSLTSPPCDENVIWNVLTKVKTISKDQVEALKAPLCEANKIKNARPTQPLNGRIVLTYDGN